jgi:hypothetical protein
VKVAERHQIYQLARRAWHPALSHVYTVSHVGCFGLVVNDQADIDEAFRVGRRRKIRRIPPLSKTFGNL